MSERPLSKYGFSDPEDIFKNTRFEHGPSPDSDIQGERYAAYLAQGGRADFEEWAKTDTKGVSARSDEYSERIKSHYKLSNYDAYVARLESREVDISVQLLRIESLVVFVIFFLLFNADPPTNLNLAWYYDLLIATLIVASQWFHKNLTIIHWMIYSVMWSFLVGSILNTIFNENSIDFSLLTASISIVIFAIFGYIRYQLWRGLKKAHISVFSYYFP